MSEREESMLTWCEECGDDMRGYCYRCEWCGAEVCSKKCLKDHIDCCIEVEEDQGEQANERKT